MIKKCQYCAELFDSPLKHQVFCSDVCRKASTKERQSSSNNKRSRRPKKCASSKCNNLVSIYSDSIYCSSCFLSDAIIAGDLKKMRRYSSAEGN